MDILRYLSSCGGLISKFCVCFIGSIGEKNQWFGFLSRFFPGHVNRAKIFQKSLKDV